MSSEEMTTDERAAWAAWEPTDAQRLLLRTSGEHLRPIFLAGFRAARDRRASPPVTTEILDLIQSCLEVAGVGEVVIDEHTARAFLAEHRGENAVTGGDNRGCLLSHEPNAETIQVLRDAREGKNLTRCDSLDELLGRPAPG